MALREGSTRTAPSTRPVPSVPPAGSTSPASPSGLAYRPGPDAWPGATTSRLAQDRAVSLLVHSCVLLTEARAADGAGDRLVTAHLAALRAVAAVLALRGRPQRRRGQPRPLSAWVQLPLAAPELAGWAPVFAAAAPRRAAVENGRAGVVSDRQAADHLAAAEAFVGEVSRLLGTGMPQRLPHLAS